MSCRKLVGPNFGSGRRPRWIASPAPARTCTFELSLPESPQRDVESHYTGRQPAPATDLQEGFSPDFKTERIDREVCTERDLFNCHGTFYELPAENAGGFAKVRPVTTHNRRVHDIARIVGSW